jgi:hypothetical protein
MPSSRANQRTALHQRELLLVTALVARQVRQLTRRADTRGIDAWWDRNEGLFHRLVLRGFVTSRALAARYLRQHAAIEGHAVRPTMVSLPAEQVAASLRVTGPVAFKTHMRATGSDMASLRTMETTLAGSAERLALEGERRTFDETFEQSTTIVGYRRVARPGACAFCLMLASRGAVYRRESSAERVVGHAGRTRGSRAIGESYHDGCRCFAAPLYDHEDEPEDVLALRERWNEASAKESGTAALNAFRRAVEAPQSA